MIKKKRENRKTQRLEISQSTYYFIIYWIHCLMFMQIQYVPSAKTEYKRSRQKVEERGEHNMTTLPSILFSYKLGLVLQRRVGRRMQHMALIKLGINQCLELSRIVYFMECVLKNILWVSSSALAGIRYLLFEHEILEVPIQLLNVCKFRQGTSKTNAA